MTAPLWWKLKEAYVENVDARVTNSPRLFRTHRKARARSFRERTSQARASERAYGLSAVPRVLPPPGGL